MDKRKGLLRVGIVLSVLWLIFMSLNLQLWKGGYYFREHTENFIIEGIVPLVIFWGLAWIIFGFWNKNNNTEDNKQDK